MQTSPRIAITMGDPGGIGPEIIARAFALAPLNDICRPVVVGDAAWMQSAAARFAPDIRVRPIADVAEAEYRPRLMDVLDLRNVPENFRPGHPTREGGSASVQYIRTAADLALQRRVEAITTAPISKEAMHLAGHFYPGHTELLADHTGTPDSVLLMAGGKLRVVLATTHIALQDVPRLLTRERLLKTLRITHRWLARHVTDKPRIALTGLNPHCGDGGIFGREEERIILPAMEDARAEGIAVEGPFSADALFPRAKTGAWDAVITMYHDQGMIPVKMESQGHAVNITLGIPLIRTSVDHGTAYDIAARGGLASHESLVAALRAAARLASATPVAR